MTVSALPRENLRHLNIWRRQRQTEGRADNNGWYDLDYGNLTNAIRDIIEAMTVDCTLAVHSGVGSMIRTNTVQLF